MQYNEATCVNHRLRYKDQLVSNPWYKEPKALNFSEHLVCRRHFNTTQEAKKVTLSSDTRPATVTMRPL